MEKRLLLAFVLSFAVLYGFRFIYPPPAPVPAEKPVVEKTETPPTPAPAPGDPAAPVTAETIQAEAPRDVKVENELYVATVSNVGGVLKSFRLKAYPDAKEEPTELIDPYSGGKVGFPLAISTADPALDKILSEARFVIAEGSDANSVSLEFRSAGVHALKTFAFDPAKYVATVTTSLERNGTKLPHQLVWQGGFGDQSVVPENTLMKSAVYEAAGAFSRTAMTGISDGVVQDVTTPMAGVEDQFFLAMFMREKPSPTKIAKSDYKLADKPDGTEGLAARSVHVSVASTQPLKVFIGPKLEKSLTAVDPRLGGVRNFGWFLFAILAKPLLVLLNWVNGFIGNYGWSIIAVTILVNLVLFPLRIKQQLTMQKMQKLAPQMRTLQDRYKKLKPGDPKRAEVEKELMEMNKQQMAGCLPMLLQMPLLFAFLNMMNAAVELRGAPWMLWIQDLSLPDHLYILPVSMGVAMFVQMKMSPTSPDPAQAKMMMITPVLVTILFLWYQSAAGLTLYWLTGNVIGIAQQWFIKEYWSDDSKPRRRRQQPSPA